MNYFNVLTTPRLDRWGQSEWGGAGPLGTRPDMERRPWQWCRQRWQWSWGSSKVRWVVWPSQVFTLNSHGHFLGFRLSCKFYFLDAGSYIHFINSFISTYNFLSVWNCKVCLISCILIQKTVAYIWYIIVYCKMSSFGFNPRFCCQTSWSLFEEPSRAETWPFTQWFLQWIYLFFFVNHRHAGVYTAEEVALITREKLIRLQSLYIDQFKRLQHLLKEKKRRYLHNRKVEHETLGKHDYLVTN